MVVASDDCCVGTWNGYTGLLNAGIRFGGGTDANAGCIIGTGGGFAAFGICLAFLFNGSKSSSSNDVFADSNWIRLSDTFCVDN